MGLYNRVTGSAGNETRIKEPKPFKDFIEAKIALKLFVITSEEKLEDCITCFPSYLWVL